MPAHQSAIFATSGTKRTGLLNHSPVGDRKRLRTQTSQFAPLGLELQSEAHLALPVWNLRTGAGGLTERTVVHVGIRVLENGAVECVEVIHLQDACESIAEEELLTRVEALVVKRRAAKFAEVTWCVRQSIRRGYP